MSTIKLATHSDQATDESTVQMVESTVVTGDCIPPNAWKNILMQNEREAQGFAPVDISQWLRHLTVCACKPSCREKHAAFSMQQTGSTTLLNWWKAMQALTGESLVERLKKVISSTSGCLNSEERSAIVRAAWGHMKATNIPLRNRVHLDRCATCQDAIRALKLID